MRGLSTATDGANLNSGHPSSDSFQPTKQHNSASCHWCWSVDKDLEEDSDNSSRSKAQRSSH